jgi:hypothetical protein
MRNRLVVMSVLLLGGCAHADGNAEAPGQIVWRLESLESIGGATPEVLGSPAALMRNGRKALCFDGKADGVFLDVNPLEGWREFTIEVLLSPDGDGPAEQRFLHIQDEQERRVLIETRVTQQRSWALDTFLRATDTDKLTLLDLAKTQPTDAWYWAALVYDGKSMAHYVDGAKQLEGSVSFPAMTAGRISLGVRQNRVHWFKGCLAQVRFTPVALEAASLRRVD